MIVEFRFWHTADVAIGPINVRSRAKTGRRFNLISDRV
jgi:hypothetical protein